jgi:hypothetical protein
MKYLFNNIFDYRSVFPLLNIFSYKYWEATLFLLERPHRVDISPILLVVRSCAKCVETSMLGVSTVF